MSVWLPVSPCTPAGCATRTGPARHPLAAAALLLTGCAAVLTGVLGAPLALLLGPAARAGLVRTWAYAVIRAFGVRVRITGPPPRRLPGPGTLVVANHVSWLDIPLVAAVAPGRVRALSDTRPRRRHRPRGPGGGPHGGVWVPRGG
ncbi:hypothetical protein ACFV4U_41250, partial [Streptomyces sp. NPDC059783]